MSRFKKISSLISGAVQSAPFGFVYIYKIELKNTGEFYIGQAEVPKRRFYRHFHCVFNTMKDKECRALPVHKHISDILKNGRKHMLDSEIEDKILKSISFSIIGIVPDKKQADFYEYGIIGNNHYNKKCLNARFIKSAM